MTDDALVYLSPSGRIRAEVTITGEHRCVQIDSSGVTPLPREKRTQPRASTTIKVHGLERTNDKDSEQSAAA